MAAELSRSGQTVMQTCTSLAVRRASRAVSQAYDEDVAGEDISSSQFTLLAQIKLKGEIATTSLAQRLFMERTTLTRNLQLLGGHGFVEVRDAPNDRRTKLVRLTEEGEAVLVRSMPCWELSQGRLRETLGDEKWTRAIGTVQDLAAALYLRKRSGVEAHPRQRPVPPPIPTVAGGLTAAALQRLKSELCMCTTLRRGVRAVSKLYDDRLKPTGMRISQFHVVAAIDAAPGALLVRLAESLTLDQTSLTRMVQHLSELCFVEQGQPGKGKRGLRLTASGQDALEAGFECWHFAQADLGRLGAPDPIETTDAMAAVLRAASQHRQPKDLAVAG